MFTNLYQKLAIATAGTALSLFALEVTPAEAAIITYDFTVDITSGHLSGNQYNGFFSYDDTATSAAGEPLEPYFDVTEFNFDFANTAFQQQGQNRTYTKSDVRYDGRSLPYSLPLEFDGGEVVEDEFGNIQLTPRGGELVRFAFSTFDAFNYENQDGWWSMFANRQGSSSFNYYFGWDDLLGDPGLSGAGNVSYALRSVPEPNTVFALGLLGAGWLLKRKNFSSRSSGLTAPAKSNS
ncbi:PEP-CTERM sorting domain-containing protein [Microcoleus sp. FACHB-672]|uniref:PEP-CTERM sorting domain-containing protein n=1 Tax=Microcoleus sp. FACHB-672 TaxID=2692825 RepID=UPI001683D4BA|nr:PEP-CTERM sorting domain-containing protein [Microcoleus sp. FACHB-672]MBD2040008.1 PEP-CTERM sorting domain-containing protein [Microcoleus sp. FACHB-672]